MIKISIVARGVLLLLLWFILSPFGAMPLGSRRILLRVLDRPPLVRSRFQPHRVQSHPGDNQHVWPQELCAPGWWQIGLWPRFGFKLRALPLVVAIRIQATAIHRSPTDMVHPVQEFPVRPCLHGRPFVLVFQVDRHHLCRPFRLGVLLDRECHQFPVIDLKQTGY